MHWQRASFLILYDIVQSVKVTNQVLCIMVIQEFKCEIGRLIWKFKVSYLLKLLRTHGIFWFVNLIACGAITTAALALSSSLGFTVQDVGRNDFLG